ncbi:MAG: hypothetical protein D8H97_45505 [Neisseria sp.]|nr:MAG: hypothetical protein D8H97_45505 [Neisseria sp.]
MKIYFLKANTKEFVIYPEPEDKSLYYEIDIDDNAGLDDKRLVEIGGGMALVDAPDSDFHTWDGKQWVLSKENQAAFLSKEKEWLISYLASKADEQKDRLLIGYPQTEIESFYRQEKEALAWQLDNSVDAPMLKQIAQARGVPFDVLVRKVIEKSNIFANAIGSIIGQRQKFEERILSATKQEELSLIKEEVSKWQFQN